MEYLNFGGYPNGSTMHFRRTKDKAEVDFIVSRGDDVLPVEVKCRELKALSISHIDVVTYRKSFSRIGNRRNYRMSPAFSFRLMLYILRYYFIFLIFENIIALYTFIYDQTP